MNYTVVIRGRTPLQHAYPQWRVVDDDPHVGELRHVFEGKIRIVRSRKRMRKLKRRGVPLMHLGYGSGFDLPGEYAYDKVTGQRLPRGPWAWFETEASYEGRKFARRMLYELTRVQSPIHYTNESFPLLERAAFAALVSTAPHVKVRFDLPK